MSMTATAAQALPSAWSRPLRPTFGYSQKKYSISGENEVNSSFFEEFFYFDDIKTNNQRGREKTPKIAKFPVAWNKMFQLYKEHMRIFSSDAFHSCKSCILYQAAEVYLTCT